jgi:hypothetical protein
MPAASAIAFPFATLAGPYDIVELGSRRCYTAAYL